MSARSCLRPGCGEAVLAWLHPDYCSRLCADLDTGRRPLLAAPEVPPIPPVPPVPKTVPDPAPATSGWLGRLLERMLR